MLATLLLALALLEPAPDAVTEALAKLQAEAKVPRTPARCVAVETAALETLAAATLTGERLRPCVVRITSAGKQPVASLAQKLEAAQVSLIFDAGYLVENPAALASFNADDRVLRVPATLLTGRTTDDPALQHELVHVAIWAAAHRDETNMIAYLHGELYAPSDLALEEMRADAEDLARAATAMKSTCKKAGAQRWQGILEARTQDPSGRDDGSACDRLFERVARALVLGRRHTDLALPALESLASVSMASEVTGDRTETILLGAAPLGDKSVPIELHLVRLAPKRIAANVVVVRALLAQVRVHQTFWRKVAESVERLSKAHPKEVAALVDTLVKQSKPPLATPAL